MAVLLGTTAAGTQLPVEIDSTGRVVCIGEPGPQGPIGLTGAQGPTGETGTQGPIGLTGAQGPTGETGSQGPIGLTGAQGPIGLTGAQGPIGLTGAQGPIGTIDTSTTFSWSAAQNFSQTQTYPRIPANTQGSAYTLVLSDAGKVVINSSGGVTVPSNVFTAGDVISIYNNSASDIALNQGSSVTMYKAGSATTGNQLIAQRGIGVVLCVASNQFVCSGVK